jgi:hypothetical protein
MTIKETLKAINAMDSVKATYKSEYKEFRLRWHNNPATDYFTCDRDDALSTARWVGEDDKRYYYLNL